ncbi:cytochrome P450 [Woodsholea maritima]|uniref:cytochrome P450 n=1 Tax=Woodsholea maritima TaxID=240237 RepID=UPI000380E1E3|nr:cytochrome P450 [Woodsholea maritima]
MSHPENSNAVKNTSNAPKDVQDLFMPVKIALSDRPLGLLEVGQKIKENGLGFVPEASRRETRLSAPFLGRTVHHISGPDEMRSVLMEHWEDWKKSPVAQRILKPVLGDAILTAHGESWRRQRMSLQPAFIKRRIERFIPAINAIARATGETLLQGEPPVEVASPLYDATYEVIETLLYTHPEADDRASVRGAIETLLVEMGALRWSDMLPLPDWMPRHMGPKAKAALRVFQNSTAQHIAQRRKSGTFGEDLLGLLLEAQDEETGQTLSDQDIRDTIMTFIAAGHETTAVTLTWTLYLLSQDLKTQDRVRAEVNAVLGEGEITAENLAQLRFTRQVIEEAMRLFPPAPIFGRVADKPSEICGYRVKRGDICMIDIYPMHRHHKLWDNPDHFDPDRWSDERRPKDRLQYLPFGAGPRACIGSSLAMMEAVIMLATFVRMAKFTPVAGYEIEPKLTITLRPKGGLPLFVERA